MVHDINTSASDLNEDLEKIGNWAFKWKMNFNPDPNKQAQEIIFSRKKTASLHPVVYFDNKPVKSSQIHKHLWMILDRWFRKLYLFYKILDSKSPSYLYNLIPENNKPYASQSALNNQIPFFNVKTNFFKNFFFPAVITE